MANKRRDDIQVFYDFCNKITRCANILFFLNFVVTFSLLYDFEIKIKNILIVVSIIFNLLYILVDNLNELYFKNKAENERRKSLIKESYDIEITSKKTNKYYNNKLGPSTERLGLNCYESSFFTKEVVKRMILPEFIKTILLLLGYIVLLIEIKELNFILLITQTIFSTEILIAFVKIIYYYSQLTKVNNKFHDIFFVQNDSKNIKVQLIDATMDYECLKSFCKISTSSKIFFKINKDVGKKWNYYISKIKIETSDIQ